MPKPPVRMEVMAQNIDETRDSILTPLQPQNQYKEERSPKSPLQNSERSRSNIVNFKKTHPRGFKSRGKYLRCSWSGCENEPIHVDAYGTSFCISHFEEGAD